MKNVTTKNTLSKLTKLTCLDQFGITLSVGDKVMFAMSDDNNYTSRITCSYYEGVVTEIEEYDLLIGKGNKELKVDFTDSNQFILELQKQANGEESMKYADNQSHAKLLLKERASEISTHKLYSNDVIRIDILKNVLTDIADGHYPEYFI